MEQYGLNFRLVSGTMFRWDGLEIFGSFRNEAERAEAQRIVRKAKEKLDILARRMKIDD
jgi:hypothetical protein